MDQKLYDLSVAGLGVMGRNLLLNLADSGFSMIGYNRSERTYSDLEPGAENKDIMLTSSIDELIQKLKRPRRILLMVPAGNPVDQMIDQLIPHLEEGDILMDGGNSHYDDTHRRLDKLKAKNLMYLGVGVSGGEEGARRGPSIMPGGDEHAYNQVGSFLEAAAAKVNNDPCVTYLGTGAAGHYVKMVHNGIEYGMMQLLAESYDLMKRGLGMSNDRIQATFAKWNKGKLDSFLVEITSKIFLQKDDVHSGEYLIDYILDQAKQKGTGKWTSQSALDLGIAVPLIDTAVMMRYLSAQKAERGIMQEHLTGPDKKFLAVKEETFLDMIEQALYISFITAYGQGMKLLEAASEEFDFHLNLKDVAKIWRGGCIIRADLLNDIMAAYDQQKDLKHLYLDEKFNTQINTFHPHLRSVVSVAIQHGIPVPAYISCLNYLDAYRSAWLPANLVQAQRDFFGAHTYQRKDKEGVFHTQWGS